MKKRTKSIISMLFALAMLISSVPVSAFASASPTAAAGGDAKYSGEYHAYMGIQTDTKLWIFRNAVDDKTYGKGTEEFDNGLSSVSNKKYKHYDGDFTDATITGDGTYTISLDKPDFKSETHLSLLFISTDIPFSKAIKVTNVTVKMDGVDKKTFDTGLLDPESKKNVKVLLLDNWNEDVKDCFTYTMPFSKCEITFTISGLGYKAKQPTVAPTKAPTKAAAAASTSTSTSDKGGSNKGVIIGVIAAVVVVVIVVVAVLASKKKKK